MEDTSEVLEEKQRSKDVNSDVFAPTPSVSNVTANSVHEAPREESSTSALVKVKRPRGRPRKYPKPTPEELAKRAKGRSHAACITCRRRKKKCDETKPGCLNCEKVAVLCEGYREKQTWKSAKEKKKEEEARSCSTSSSKHHPQTALPEFSFGFLDWKGIAFRAQNELASVSKQLAALRKERTDLEGYLASKSDQYNFALNRLSTLRERNYHLGKDNAAYAYVEVELETITNEYSTLQAKFQCPAGSSYGSASYPLSAHPKIGVNTGMRKQDSGMETSTDKKPLTGIKPEAWQSVDNNAAFRAKIELCGSRSLCPGPPVSTMARNFPAGSILKENVPDMSIGKRREPDEIATQYPPPPYVISSCQMQEKVEGRNLFMTEKAKLEGERWQNLAPAEKELYDRQTFSTKDRYNNDLAECKNMSIKLEIIPASSPVSAPIEVRSANPVAEEDEIEDEDEDEDLDSCSTEFDSDINWAWTALDGHALTGQDSVSAVLQRSRDDLLEALMSQFWMTASKSLTGNVRVHADYSSTSSASISGFRTSSTSSFTSSSGKRVSQDDDEEFPEEDDDRRPKKPRIPSTVRESLGESAEFACPYRKHNPRKYNIREWTTCALTPQRTFARVKGHLYRYHIIHQCQRCKDLFGSQEELDTHILSLQGCDVKPLDPSQSAEGITAKLKEILQCRKKARPDQTEAERWQQMYRLIFPNEIVPSPYFEPVRDQLDDELDSQKRSSYEQYLRRELPRCFRQALEAAVDNEIRSLGDGLSGRLLTLLDEAQKQAFDNYQTADRKGIEIVPNSFQSGQNYNDFKKNERDTDPADGNNSGGLSETWHGDERPTLGKSPQAASQAFGDASTAFSAESGLKEPELPHRTTFNGTTESLISNGSEFAAPNHNVLIRQLELGGLNSPGQDRLPGTDNIDWNLLLFDFDPQKGVNGDIGM